MLWIAGQDGCHAVGPPGGVCSSAAYTTGCVNCSVNALPDRLGAYCRPGRTTDGREGSSMSAEHHSDEEPRMTPENARRPVCPGCIMESGCDVHHAIRCAKGVKGSRRQSEAVIAAGFVSLGPWARFPCEIGGLANGRACRRMTSRAGWQSPACTLRRASTTRSAGQKRPTALQGGSSWTAHCRPHGLTAKKGGGVRWYHTPGDFSRSRPSAGWSRQLGATTSRGSAVKARTGGRFDARAAGTGVI